MCNTWTSEHVFMWTGGSTTNAKPPDDTPCQCNLLTWKEASELALKALHDAEKRRQEEREKEAEWWRDA
jgi:hypothetical protein